MNRSLALISFIALFISCTKDPPLWTIENLTGNQIKILGHGGMGIFSLYPIDSKESIKKSIDLGADGSEIDIQMSRDSVLFTYHNELLHSSTKCTGKILEKSANEINCEYESLVHPGLKISRLSALFDEIEKGELIYTFECKLNGNSDPAYYNAFANKLVDHIELNSLQNTALIESTDPEFLKLLKNKSKNLRLFLYTVDFIPGLHTAKELDLFGLTFDMNNITAEEIKMAHQNNIRITLFNQQTEDDNLKAVQMSPDYIQTDKLEHLLKVFEKKK